VSGQCLLLALAVAVERPLPARAQIQVAPSLGVYVPIGGDLIEEFDTDGRPRLKKRQIGGGVLTTRVTAWLNGSLGFEGSLAISPALVAIHDSLMTVRDVRAILLLASARGVLRLTPERLSEWTVDVAGGVGAIRRSGKAWADTPASATVAFVLAVSARRRIGKPSGIAFRFDLEDYMSWAQFNRGLATQTRSQLHHDLTWTIGLVIPIDNGPRSTEGSPRNLPGSCTANSLRDRRVIPIGANPAHPAACAAPSPAVRTPVRRSRPVLAGRRSR
jgi:hypothetical protein